MLDVIEQNKSSILSDYNSELENLDSLPENIREFLLHEQDNPSYFEYVWRLSALLQKEDNISDEQCLQLLRISALRFFVLFPDITSDEDKSHTETSLRLPSGGFFALIKPSFQKESDKESDKECRQRVAQLQLDFYNKCTGEISNIPLDYQQPTEKLLISSDGTLESYQRQKNICLEKLILIQNLCVGNKPTILEKVTDKNGKQERDFHAQNGLRQVRVVELNAEANAIVKQWEAEFALENSRVHCTKTVKKGLFGIIKTTTETCDKPKEQPKKQPKKH